MTTLTPGARRILDVASELFYAHGIHAVGVDTIAAESGVTKRTLYDRFGSKDELVAAYLRARDERWRARVTAAVEAFAELDDPAHPGRAVIADEKRWLEELFAAELARAGIDDADLALHLLLLHEGALVTYAVAERPAALRIAREGALRACEQKSVPEH
jgi:AcrR family transcriptional regulator